MKTILTGLLALLMFQVVAQNLISKEQAGKVATRFYSERAAMVKGIEAKEISLLDIKSIYKSDNTVYYICQMNPSGFVLVSANKKVIPVLAYSFEMPFPETDKIPNGINYWLDNYAKQIDYAKKSTYPISQEIEMEWERLSSESKYRNPSFLPSDAIEPLLSSKWNQDNPYNGWCPNDINGPGGHCYAGCVATAMGQLLYYYRFPQIGLGEYTYLHPEYGTITANFGQANYDWYQMPSAINSSNDEIPKLLFHQGVSVDMDYGPDGSGMWNHKAAYSLKTYFRYGPETQYYFRDSITLNWDSLIIANLNQRKPLYYAGWAGVQSNSGHAFVCDGYQPGNYYHFNWGWGGSMDGYFYTDNLTPGGNVFNFAQEIIPLFPDTLSNTYPQLSNDTVILSKPKGSVEDGSGWYFYANNHSRSWIISPQTEEYDSIQSIKITFNKLNIEDDSLYIFKLENEIPILVGTYTGNNLPSIITIPANKLLVQFYTNSSINANGWHFDYESKFPIYCSGITTLNGQNGMLSDGSGNKKYSNNSMCRWKIIPSEIKPITLVFTSFALADSGDFVKVIDLQTQEVIGNFTGTQIPQPVTVTSGKMMVMFISNTNQTESGWTAEYYASETEITESDVEEKYLIYPNPAKEGFFIKSKSGFDKDISIQLISLTGQVAYEKSVKVHPKSNFLWIETENLPKMAYFLLIQEIDKKITRKKIIVI